MATKRFISNTNLGDKKSHKEDYTGQPSMTIPGEAFSVGELYARSMRGEDLSLMERFGIYDDDPHYDDPILDLRKPDVDLTDWQEIAERLHRTKEAIKAYRADPTKKPAPPAETEPPTGG